MGLLLTEPAADFSAACQVVIDVQTPLAQVSVAEALVVVVVETASARATARGDQRQRGHDGDEVALRMDFIGLPFRRVGRAGVCAGPLSAIYEVIAPDTSAGDFEIAFCSSS